MENLTPGLWYATYLDRRPQAKEAVVDLQKLANILPHGSGIDGNWTISVKRNGDVTVYGEYHAMNDNGFYDGWLNFRFSLRRATKNEYHLLGGLYEGKWQVTRKKGTVYLMSFVGGGDAADYLYDSVAIPISDDLGIKSITSDIVDSEEAARSLR